MTVAVVGHSGSGEGVMPASLAAYEAAIEVGVDMVEVDARWSADGVAVAVHDPDVEGVPVAELSAAEIRAREPHTAGVEAVLELAAERSVPVMLDLKDVGREAEAVELCRRLPAGGFAISTLEDVSVAAIRRDVPDVEVGLSLEAPGGPELLRRADACGARFLSLDVKLDLVSAAATAGYPCFVWTVDDEPTMRRLLADRRVRGLITNRPAAALALRRQMRFAS